MAKVVQPLLAVAAIAVNVIPGVGQVLSAAMITAITTAGITAGIGIASSALGLGPKSPSVNSATHDRLYASIDPATFRKMVFGTTALATDIRYQEWNGAEQEYLDQIVCVASHRITDYQEIWLDDKLAWTAAGGAQGEFAGYLTITPVLEGTAGNYVVIANGAKWGANRRMTGLAYLRMRFKITGNGKKKESPFAQSIPNRLTIIGRACPVYDPRFDSTRGGSGPMRADDQTTWAFTLGGYEIGRNPALQLLTYLLGWRINGRLAVGRGIPPARIDFDSFMTAANACDEPVARVAGGNEPRYRSDGIFSEGDDARGVIDTYEATMNAKLRDAGGRYTLTVISNDLATPRFDFNDDDVLGGFRWTPTPDIDKTFNEIRGRYTNPDRAALFQLVDYPRYRQVPLDGVERVHPLDLPMVQSPSQAQRLAKQQFARNQYQGQFECQMGQRGWAIQLGDVVTLTFSALGWDKRLFRVIEHGIRPDGVCPIVLQEENAAIYLWDKDERPAVQPVQPVPYDPSKSVLFQLLVAGEIEYADGRTLQEGFDDIHSDAILSAGPEKREARSRYDALIDDRDQFEERYVALGSPADVTPARNAAFAAIAAHLAYLESLVPAWTNRDVDTPISPSDWLASWRSALDAQAGFRAAVTGRPGADGRDGVNGNDGAPGAPGANGQSTYFHVAYSNSANGQTDFTTGAPGTRKYIGVRVDQTPADSGNYLDYEWSLIRGADGLNGADGVPGAPGADGQPTYVHFAYSNAADGSVAFSTTDPTNRTYLGVYSDNVLADSNNPAAYTWSLVKGADGRDGVNGNDGAPGAPGANGLSTYFHVAYANSANGQTDFTTGAPGTRKYIGVRVDQTPTDSGNYLDYEWSLIRGADGLNGADGVPGAPGANGQPTYVHFAYSNAPDGSIDFSTTDPTNRKYIGVYSDYTLADSNSPGAYTWSLVKGEDGPPGSPGAPGAPGTNGGTQGGGSLNVSGASSSGQTVIGSSDASVGQGTIRFSGPVVFSGSSFNVTLTINAVSNKRGTFTLFQIFASDYGYQNDQELYPADIDVTVSTGVAAGALEAWTIQAVLTRVGSGSAVSQGKLAFQVV